MKTNRNDNFIMKPKVDYCFKELMEDEEVRMAFLAAALDISMKEIISTTLMPTHLRKTFQEEKLGILDVRVLMKDKTQVDIEIQIAPYPFWQERSLFYLSKMYSDQITFSVQRAKRLCHVILPIFYVILSRRTSSTPPLSALKMDKISMAEVEESEGAKYAFLQGT